MKTRVWKFDPGMTPMKRGQRFLSPIDNLVWSVVSVKKAPGGGHFVEVAR
jgi:hypothetical protein